MLTKARSRKSPQARNRPPSTMNPAPHTVSSRPEKQAEASELDQLLKQINAVDLNKHQPTARWIS